MLEPNHILNDVTFIETKLDSHYLFEVKIKEDWPYFKGHFKTTSVLPLVSTIDISLMLLKKYVYKNQDFHLSKINSIKAHNAISPMKILYITLIVEDKKISSTWHRNSCINRLRDNYVTLSFDLNY